MGGQRLGESRLGSSPLGIGTGAAASLPTLLALQLMLFPGRQVPPSCTCRSFTATSLAGALCPAPGQDLPRQGLVRRELGGVLGAWLFFEGCLSNNRGMRDEVSDGQKHLCHPARGSKLRAPLTLLSLQVPCKSLTLCRTPFCFSHTCNPRKQAGGRRRHWGSWRLCQLAAAPPPRPGSQWGDIWVNDK